MIYLVTGAAGFIGSNLCARLLEDGHEVIGVDNFYTGRKSNLTLIGKHPRFELIRHDVTMPLYIECDAIFNLACPASPIHYQHDPVQTTKTSVHGAINLLGLAKRLKIPILQASTSEVYGSAEQHPQREEYWGNVNPIGVRSCYDEGKRCAETLFVDYHRQYGVDIKIARIFNTYGPHMQADDGRVVSNFIVQALRGKEIMLYGSGKQTRSFCYVSDTIDALVRLMQSHHTGPINIGNPQEITIESLAFAIIELTGGNCRMSLMPLPDDDPPRRCPDITLARMLLDWVPRIDLHDGLRRTIDYFAQQPIA